MKAKEIALKFNECINNQNVEGLFNLMTEDHRFVDVRGGGFQGKAKSIEIWKTFFKKYPEYRNIFDNAFSRG